MTDFEKLLSGGDLRSIGKSNFVVSEIQNQNDFDCLFEYLFHQDRIIVMRTADAIEKITTKYPNYLSNHKKRIFELTDSAIDKELKWHLALLIPRLNLDNGEFGIAWNIFTSWVKDKTNSRIVRVNALQGLFELMVQHKELEQDFKQTLSDIEIENIPSINARIKKLKTNKWI